MNEEEEDNDDDDGYEQAVRIKKCERERGRRREVKPVDECAHCT